jgi:REP element-mobilizing transposase RayT
MGRNQKPRRPGVLTPEETHEYKGAIFHVWCRAIDDMHAFPGPLDKAAFLERFERHLSPRRICDRYYNAYRKLFEDVELIAFNILDNHYHLLIRQRRPGGLFKLMRAVLTSYGHYFNKEHGRRAQIFESPYSVRMAVDDDDVRGLIAYIHSNEEVIGLDYAFASHREYMGRRESDWLASASGLAFFDSRAAYAEFVAVEFEAIRDRKVERRQNEPLPETRQISRGRVGHVLRNDPGKGPLLGS